MLSGIVCIGPAFRPQFGNRESITNRYTGPGSQPVNRERHGYPRLGLKHVQACVFFLEGLVASSCGNCYLYNMPLDQSRVFHWLKQRFTWFPATSKGQWQPSNQQYQQFVVPELHVVLTSGRQYLPTSVPTKGWPFAMEPGACIRCL